MQTVQIEVTDKLQVVPHKCRLLTLNLFATFSCQREYLNINDDKNHKILLNLTFLFYGLPFVLLCYRTN